MNLSVVRIRFCPGLAHSGHFDLYGILSGLERVRAPLGGSRGSYPCSYAYGWSEIQVDGEVVD